MDIVSLSDGQSAVSVQLALPTVYSGCASLNGVVWLLSRNNPVATVRNARTAEVLAKVDLLEDGLAIAAVGSRIWIATASNKVYIFNADGTLIGALQANGLPLVRRFFVLAPDVVLSSGGGKDLTVWDTAQFCVSRTLYGRVPGDTIIGVAAANASASSVIVLYQNATRVFGIDGNAYAELAEGGTAIACFPDSVDASSAELAAATGSKDAASRTAVWIAQTGWITIFSMTDPSKTTRLVREKTIPCSGVRELVVTGPGRVASLDVEGLVTLWNVADYTPIRAFKTSPALGLEGAPTSFTFHAAHTTCASLWTVSTEGRAMIWTDEFAARDGKANGPDDFGFVVDIQQDEIDYLRKKCAYVESISNVFRTKVGDLMKDRHAQHLHATFHELDNLYGRALTAWKEQHGNREPLVGAGGRGGAQRNKEDRAEGGGSSDFVEYWKAKYQESTTELENLKGEYSNLLVLLHQQKGSTNELEVTRAHHICQVIKEKNELRERERQLSEDVTKLRAKLREYNSPLASRGPVEDTEGLRHENADLKQQLIKLQAQMERQATQSTESQHAAKHNQILKQRVKKLRSDLDDAQLALSTSTVEAQRNIESLLDSVSQLKTQLEQQRVSTAEFEQAKASSEIEVAQQQATIDKLRARVDTLERDLSQREAVEKAAQAEVRSEMTMLCQSLDDRDRRIVDLQVHLNDAKQHAREQGHAAAASAAEVEAKRIEIDALQQRITHMESVLNDRKQYARTVGELQGRMELAVEELRRSFTPVQFAETIGNLEQRVSNLFALEAQLRQKDDIIALRDDTIQQLRTHIEKVEKQMQQVSSVFMHLPKSVEEVELLMVEVDEYRRRLGMDPDTQELVQLRLLELQAKRKAGEPVPPQLDLNVTPNTIGKSAQELERLKQMTEAMSALAHSLAKDDKTGLVRTPSAVEKPPAPAPVAEAPKETPVSAKPAAAAAAAPAATSSTAKRPPAGSVTTPASTTRAPVGSAARK